MRIKAGDTAPNIIITCLSGSTPVNLTGATVRVRVRELSTGKSVLDRAGTITDGSGGVVDGGDGSTLAVGAYQVHAVVTFSNGEIETFPQGSYLELLVKPAIPVPV